MCRIRVCSNCVPYHHGNPNEMWGTWKNLLMNVIDRHAPLRTWRISSKQSPWVTNELKHLMFKRDYLNKRAISSKDPEKWCEYRHARNQVNNEIKKAKRFYFTKNLDIHKGDIKRSWKLINNGNWTKWSATWSEIKRMITKSHDREAGVRFVITSLISDQNCTTRSAISDPLYYIHFEIYKRQR